MDMDENWSVVDWEEVMAVEVQPYTENTMEEEKGEDVCKDRQNKYPRRGVVLKSESEDYVVLRPLGKGAYGQVFRCARTRREQEADDVAVKVLVQGTTTSSDHQELTMMKRLRAGVASENDPRPRHVVSFLEAFTCHGHLCLAMELMPCTLSRLLRTLPQRKTPLPLVKHVARQVVSAMHWIQDLNIIHADLKPNNILVDAKGFPWRVKLADFGCAFLTKQCDAVEGQVLQVLSYRAPEVIMGAPISASIDMWSLGCILAEMYLGKKLFAGNSQTAQLHLIVSVLGNVPKWYYHFGMNSQKFFSRCPMTGKYQLKAHPKVQNQLSDIMAQRPLSSLKDIPDVSFASFLQKCLWIDPAQRLRPSTCLRHRFLTKPGQPVARNPKLIQESE